MDIGARFGFFWKAFFGPEQVFAAEAASKSKVTMADGAINNLLAFLIVPLAIIFFSFFAPDGGVAMGLVIGILALVVMMVLNYVVSALYHFISGLLGGKGSLEKTYYVLSIYNAVCVYSYVVIMVLYLGALWVASNYPVAAIIVLPVALLVVYTIMIYLFYQLVLAIKATNGISSLKGIFAMMVAVGIIVAAIMLVLFAMFGSALLGAMAGQSSLGAYPGGISP